MLGFLFFRQNSSHSKEKHTLSSIGMLSIIDFLGFSYSVAHELKRLGGYIDPEIELNFS